MAAPMKNTRETNLQDRFLDCITGEDIDSLIEENQDSSRKRKHHKPLEIPTKHTQIDGRTNNVTFMTQRPETWKNNNRSLWPIKDYIHEKPNSY